MKDRSGIAVVETSSPRNTIRNIDEVITTVMGKDMATDDGLPLTIRLGILLELSSHKAGHLQALQLLDISLKLRTAVGDFELDQSDWALVKEVVEKNPVGFGALVLAQLYRRFV